MTDKPHTPTTEEVRDGYSRKPPGHAVSKARERQAAEFDRWIAERDARIIAAAEQRGAPDPRTRHRNTRPTGG